VTIRWTDLDVGGSRMRAYAASPEKPRGAIVLAHHAGGLDEPMQDFVHRMFRAGYAVIAPDLFHRQPAGTERRQRSSLLLDVELVADMEACAEYLLRQCGPLPLAVVGFCMGGRVSYLAATAMPKLAAAVVFYGGNIFEKRGDGPSSFDRTEAIACPLLMISGAEDTNPSPADQARIGAELSRLGKRHEVHLYADAGHAFQNFMEERYRPRAARASWGEMTAFLCAHVEERR
jgi:carboxymethylenebutenolidase